MATIGIFERTGSSSALIFRVASRPFITGISISIRTRSISPGFEFFTISTASIPLEVSFTVKPNFLSTRVARVRFTFVSSTKRIVFPSYLLSRAADFTAVFSTDKPSSLHTSKGSTTVNSLPSPSSVSRLIVPCIKFTIFFTINIPSPVP